MAEHDDDPVPRLTREDLRRHTALELACQVRRESNDAGIVQTAEAFEEFLRPPETTEARADDGVIDLGIVRETDPVISAMNDQRTLAVPSATVGELDRAIRDELALHFPQMTEERVRHVAASTALRIKRDLEHF